MYKKLSIYFILTISLFMLGCTRQTSINVSSGDTASTGDKEKNDAARISELVDRINSYESEIKSVKSENDYYKNYINKLIGNLTEEELLKLAKDEWKYNLELDGKKVPAQGIVDVDKQSFKIVLSESQGAYQALPAGVHNKGQISGDTYGSHIKFLNIRPDYTEGSDGTMVSAQTYVFSSVPNKSNVEIEITKELQERLGLMTNIIHINVK